MKKNDFNLDAMHRDTYGEGNRAYQLRKGHCDLYSKDGVELYFSYETLVAFKVPNYQLVSIENCWGTTTGKHLNWIGEPKDARLSSGDFEKVAKECLEPYGVLDTSDPSDPMKTVGMVSAMFDLLCQDDKEASLKYRKRFYAAGGLSFPPDWDELPAAERAERLAKVDNVALKGVE
jgi:hypothetical protein